MPLAEGPAPLDIVDGVAQFVQAIVGHGSELHAKTLGDQLLQAGLVPEFQLQFRSGHLAQARLELGPVRAIRAIDHHDDAIRVRYRRRGLLVLANEMLDHAVAGVAVFHFDEKGRPARRTYHDVGEGTRHAQVDLARDLHAFGAEVVMPHDLKTAYLAADLLQKQAQLAQEVDMLGGLGKGHCRRA